MFHLVVYTLFFITDGTIIIQLIAVVNESADKLCIP